MMTKKLETILLKLNIPRDIQGLNVQWKTQDSNENSFLFYTLRESGKNQIKVAKERLANSKFKYCFINSTEAIDLPNIIAINNEVFKTLEEELLNALYPYNKKIFTLGITGTNGKTTTIDLIRQLAILKKLNVLTIGTLGVYLNENQVENFNLTSPNYIDLRKTLNKYSKDIDVFAMELSSHALVQNRSGSLKFDKIGWTNLTQDHLDYHETMEGYLKAKKIVFKKIKNNMKVLIPESQAELAKKINKEKQIELVSVEKTLKNPFFKMNYNLDNLSLAINSLSSITNFSTGDFEKLTPPDGRFNIINYLDSYIVIDYAHTPDALESICRELKISFPQNNLITIFGCGGDRDKSKRPQMAEAARKHSNYLIVTSDNPRFEKPEQIIKDTVVGLEGDFEICVDRKAAINLGFNMLNKSVLLIAGKGHENYIDQNGIKKPYSDLQTVQELMND
jgi:UDP-N-acetylmuramoyl-L-alanyl-D-glutamate--2,6-diaminopimelate ligase